MVLSPLDSILGSILRSTPPKCFATYSGSHFSHATPLSTPLRSTGLCCSTYFSQNSCGDTAPSSTSISTFFSLLWLPSGNRCPGGGGLDSIACTSCGFIGAVPSAGVKTKRVRVKLIHSLYDSAPFLSTS